MGEEAAKQKDHTQGPVVFKYVKWSGHECNACGPGSGEQQCQLQARLNLAEFLKYSMDDSKWCCMILGTIQKSQTFRKSSVSGQLHIEQTLREQRKQENEQGKAPSPLTSEDNEKGTHPGSIF